MKRALSVWVPAVAMFMLWSSPVHASSCAGGKDIVATAAGDGRFTTLVTAVKAAGLVDALQGKGPLTVFAPTDEAFAKLPQGTLQSLLENPDKLRDILLYHVVSGQFRSADVIKQDSVKTLNGAFVSIDTAKSVTVNDATVIATDVSASNGVIHVIDTDILPRPDLVEVARSAGSFNTLLTAVEAAGLADALRDEGPFTLFAPTDEAFAKLPEGTLGNLLKDKEKLQAILRYHVVPDWVTAGEVVSMSEATTLQGSKLMIDGSDGVKIGNARVVTADVKAGNGIIHVIDNVMIPN